MSRMQQNIQKIRKTMIIFDFFLKRKKDQRKQLTKIQIVCTCIYEENKNTTFSDEEVKHYKRSILKAIPFVVLY